MKIFVIPLFADMVGMVNVQKKSLSGCRQRAYIETSAWKES